MDETAKRVQQAAATTRGRTLSSPSEEERLALIHALQAQALMQPDPLTANLQLLSGDLMLFAHRARQILEASLQGAGNGVLPQEQFIRQAELHLKFARQIDRLTQCMRPFSRKDIKKGT